MACSAAVDGEMVAVVAGKARSFVRSEHLYFSQGATTLYSCQGRFWPTQPHQT